MCERPDVGGGENVLDDEVRIPGDASSLEFRAKFNEKVFKNAKG